MTNMMYLLDTNLVMRLPKFIGDLDGFSRDDVFYIADKTIQELERLKTAKNVLPQTNGLARAGANHLIKHELEYAFIEDYDPDIHDGDTSLILTAKHNDLVFLTCDHMAYLRAKHSFNAWAEMPNGLEERYFGYREIPLETYMSDDEGRGLENLGWNANEYGVVVDENDDIYEIIKYIGEEDRPFIVLDGETDKKKYKSFTLGDVEPLDFSQRMVFDSQRTNQITVVTGKAGSGKTFLHFAHAMSGLERGVYDKIVVFTNPTKSKYSQDIGFLKGTREDKLLNGNIGNILYSKLGDFTVDDLMNRGQLDIVLVADVRGYEVPPNSCIIITEAQNLNNDLMRLILTRCRDDSKILIDGDATRQVDNVAFEGSQNGLNTLINKTKNLKEVGYVELAYGHRSHLEEVWDEIFP